MQGPSTSSNNTNTVGALNSSGSDSIYNMALPRSSLPAAFCQPTEGLIRSHTGCVSKTLLFETVELKSHKRPYCGCSRVAHGPVPPGSYDTLPGCSSSEAPTPTMISGVVVRRSRTRIAISSTLTPTPERSGGTRDRACNHDVDVGELFGPRRAVIVLRPTGHRRQHSIVDIRAKADHEQ